MQSQGMQRWWVLMALAVVAVSAAGAPLPIESLAARPVVQSADLSPSGRYVAMIQTVRGKTAVTVLDREHPDAPAKGIMGEPPDFRYRWCRFASDTRLLCSLLGITQERGTVYGVTRLVAVDADGKNMLVLLQNSSMVQGQFLDRVIHWHPGVPDTVLIEADEGFDAHEMHGSDVGVIGNVGTHAAPAVFELNVRTGKLRLRQSAHLPVRNWVTDADGAVRLGFGVSGTIETYFARLKGSPDLKRIERFEAFSRDKKFTPLAFSATSPDEIYAEAAHGAHQALWRYDLTEKKEPELVISSTRFDISEFVFGPDAHLEGVVVEGEKPVFYATDARIDEVLQMVNKLLPDTFNRIIAASADQSVYLVSSRSDKALTQFRVLDLGTKKLSRLNRMPEDLPEAAMSAMKSVQYPARDGTAIPGYLSLPPGVEAKHLPLIVMPHGGPIARDDWGYFFLTQFLTSRGYAVLQMNFRGSAGYGPDWFYAAHQDWGGLTYDDVTDGARWAVAQGIADPQRMCIVGWSFGGYIAFLGGQRNPDLYRCAVSIAGISDLAELYDEESRYVDAKIFQRQIGTDLDKLRRDSPREHAADYRVPVLFLQGDMDTQVRYQQGDAMDKALTRAGKPHRYVKLPGADHSLTREADRVTLLKELDAFLSRENPAQTAP